MISRSTLVGALVVVELAIVGVAIASFDRIGAPSIGSRADASPGGPGSTTPGHLHQTFPTGPAPHVVIDVRGVDVAVEAANGPTVAVDEATSVSGWVSGSVTPITAAQSADGVRIATPAGGDGNIRVMIGELSRKLRITVPAGARVEITSAGTIDARGLRSKLVAHSPDGNVHVRDHRGDVDVSTDDGRVELIDVAGDDVTANTHDGRIYFTRVAADRMHAHSNYGRIYAVDLRVKDGALNTHSGRISASFTAASDATVHATTGDGNVTIAGVPASDADDGKTVRLGSGQGRFEVSTDEGAVNIAQGANV